VFKKSIISFQLCKSEKLDGHIQICYMLVFDAGANQPYSGERGEAAKKNYQEECKLLKALRWDGDCCLYNPVGFLKHGLALCVLQLRENS